MVAVTWWLWEIIARQRKEGKASAGGIGGNTAGIWLCLSHNNCSEIYYILQNKPKPHIFAPGFLPLFGVFKKVVICMFVILIIDNVNITWDSFHPVVCMTALASSFSSLNATLDSTPGKLLENTFYSEIELGAQYIIITVQCDPGPSQVSRGNAEIIPRLSFPESGHSEVSTRSQDFL